MNYYTKIYALFFTLFVSVMCLYAQSNSVSSVGIGVKYRTQKEISNYILRNSFDMSAAPAYDITPSIKRPYKVGKLSEAELQNALNSVNVVRFIAGLQAVTLSQQYNNMAQHAALLNAVNNTLSHYPKQPLGFNKEAFQLGYKGASESNIAWNSKNNAEAVIGSWMEDADNSNIQVMGHRRWILNPTMNSTGFGQVESFLAMYSFDVANNQNEVSGVIWPAQNMPVEYFTNIFPWSISMGYEVSSDAHVKLTRLNDSKVWNFHRKTKYGYFNINNEAYGQKGLIVFRPNDLSYKAGDSFIVEITGLQTDVKYQVDFFSVGGQALSNNKIIQGDAIVEIIETTNTITETSNSTWVETTNSNSQNNASKFTVEFVYGENISAPETYEVEKGTIFSLPQINLEGYDFKFIGWIINGKLYKGGYNYEITDNTKAVAKYK